MDLKVCEKCSGRRLIGLNIRFFDWCDTWSFDILFQKKKCCLSMIDSKKSWPFKGRVLHHHKELNRRQVVKLTAYLHKFSIDSIGDNRWLNYSFVCPYSLEHNLSDWNFES